MSKNSKEKIIKDILSGKYRDCYLIYDRRSTDEPDSQKNSLSYQKTENLKLVKRENIKLAPITLKGFCVNGIISEKHSGFKEDSVMEFTANGKVQFKIDRPKFHQMSQFLNRKLFKGAVFLCWDRASRNKADDVLIKKLLKQGIDFKFAYAIYDDTSSGALHMDIDAMFSAHHSRVTSEKVTINIRNLRDQGVCTYKAPIGYLNLGDMHNKPFDPEKAPIIKQVFEMYATGDWSIPDLTKWCNEQGLTTVPMRRRKTKEEKWKEEVEDIEIKIDPVSRPITESYLHKVLDNRFYTGRVIGNDGEWIVSVSHEALISDELFEKVKKLRQKKKVSVHYTNKLNRPYRGFVRCEDCDRTFCPYEQKGTIYYSLRCKKDCNNSLKNINADFLEKKLGEKIKNLYFTQEELEEIDARTKTDLKLFENKRQKELEQLERKKKVVREDLDYLRTNKLTLLKTGTYSPQDLLNEETILSEKLNDFHEQEQASDQAIHEVVKDLLKLSELLENGAIYWENANTEEREKIARIIFSELLVSENNVVFSLKDGFKPFETRIFSVCELTVPRMEHHRNYG